MIILNYYNVIIVNFCFPQTIAAPCLSSAFSLSENPVVDWPDELRVSGRILCQLSPQIAGNKSNATRPDESSSMADRPLTSPLSTAVSLSLGSFENSFYFRSMSDFLLLRNQVEGAAYTEEDIFSKRNKERERES